AVHSDCRVDAGRVAERDARACHPGTEGGRSGRASWAHLRSTGSPRRRPAGQRADGETPSPEGGARSFAPPEAATQGGARRGGVGGGGGGGGGGGCEGGGRWSISARESGEWPALSS